jgi:hypothetical protein
MLNRLDNMQAVRRWIDLNCPSSGGHQHRDGRAARKTLATAHPVGFNMETSK